MWKRLSTRRMTRGGPYRRSVHGVDPQSRGPLVVRAAALSSFFLGGACVPVATMGFAMLVNGEGWAAVALVPAIVLARVWMAGARLLDPDVESLRSVRNAARLLVHLTLPLAVAS